MSSEIPDEEGTIPEGGLLNVDNGDHWDQLVREGVIQPATPEEVLELLRSHGLPSATEQPIFEPEDLVIDMGNGSGSPGYTGKKPDAIVYRVGGPLSDTGIQ